MHSTLTLAMAAAVAAVCAARMPYAPYAPYYQPPTSRFFSLPSIPFFGTDDKFEGYAWEELHHNDAPAQYVQWKHGVANAAEGLTFGVECKGKSCEDRSAFTTRPEGKAPLSSAAVHTRWTTPGKSSQIACPENSFVSQIECRGEMCTSARLLCAPLTSMYRAVYNPRVVSNYDGHSRAYCPPGKYMDGFWCLKDCNTFYLLCTSVENFRPSAHLAA